MSFYLRVQRLSDGYAARVFEELWPDQRTRRNVAVFLQSFLERAAAGTTAWSVTLDPDSVRLNVGPVRLLSLTSEFVWFCALPSEQERWPRWVRDVSEGPMVYPRSVPVESLQLTVAPARVGSLPKSLTALAFQYVDQAALRRKGRSAWLKSNSPGVLRFLESYLGCTLSRPYGDSTSDSDFAPWPTEIEDGRTYAEGVTRRVVVNLVERSQAARKACLEHHGKRCSVCGVLLAERYGAIAADLIHVHHRRPLSEIRSIYEVSPIEDLCPICPNCHAVVHLLDPPIPIEEARALLRECDTRDSPANTTVERAETAKARFRRSP